MNRKNIIDTVYIPRPELHPVDEFVVANRVKVGVAIILIGVIVWIVL